MPQSDQKAFVERIVKRSIVHSTSLDFETALAGLLALKGEVERADLDDVFRASARFTLSSCLINVSTIHASQDGLSEGLQWTLQALGDPATPDHLFTHFALNSANAQVHMFELLESESGVGQSSSPAFRIDNLQSLREARRIYMIIGNDYESDDSMRSVALCNLANALDESGRWVEAYACYADALEADPKNGNAAGNIAELLRRRLLVGSDQSGHLAAVYDTYVIKAQSLRDHTVQIAGEDAARRWDRLELTGSEGHLAHAGDALDEYQCWIVENRLALVAAVEGLGSDGERWDSAALKGHVPVGDTHAVPPIFAAMNVLKAEYLTARRLAFRGQGMLGESPTTQHPDDTGEYTDTLDGAIYGEACASLLLAQRSALDVLDKVAVTANEYFGTGKPASRVSFSNFWFDEKTGVVSPRLEENLIAERSRLALAELASDVDERGMYSLAKLLRNAGTHRLVHATLAIPTGPTKATFSTVDVDDLMAATVQALSVTRAAYLYLIDLVQGHLPDAPLGAEHVLQLPLQK